MAKDPKKRQKSLARKAAKRKAKKKAIKKLSALSAQSSSIDKVGKWPLIECLISADWRDTYQLGQIIVARQASTGHVAMGVFLIDLGCLGVKNAMAEVFPSINAYHQGYRAKVMEMQPMESCDLDLAAKVIDEAIKYAHSLGFKPHRDTRKALKVLGEANPYNSAETVPLGGKDGKPLFIAGPYDNSKRIIQILERNVGAGNYNYSIPVEDSSSLEELFDLG